VLEVDATNEKSSDHHEGGHETEHHRDDTFSDTSASDVRDVVGQLQDENEEEHEFDVELVRTMTNNMNDRLG
jgi:hypothetical protein